MTFIKMSSVDVGYLKKCEPWLLKSHFFPSKVGGKPAWLNLKQLPSAEELQCQVCKDQMIFLCQVYAPIEENALCFHRTLFLFVCRNATCSVPNKNNNFLIWRSQIPRENEFYSSEPPIESPTNVFNINKHVKLCIICGSSASKHCSKCKVTFYCSREHQAIGWVSGHKKTCRTNKIVNESSTDILFDEYELITEQEDDEDNSESDDETEEKRLEDYQKLIKEGKVGSLSYIPEEDLQSHAVINEDETFSDFRKCTAKNPEQVLRYNRGGEPLWIASDPRPAEIPDCELCKSPRQFEFQVLPQLLYILHEDNVDWGTVAVYTCKENCNDGPAYKKEFVFKQDIKANVLTGLEI